MKPGSPHSNPRPAESVSKPPRRVDSSSLLAGADEVEIEHDGTIYRLRKTALGKLILTK